MAAPEKTKTMDTSERIDGHARVNRRPGVGANGTTDLKGLAVYTLNLAHSNAGKSLILANSLAKATTNPQLKQRYSFCAESYDEVVGDIENAQNDLALGDFIGVIIVTTGAMTTLGDHCQNKLLQPPKDTSLLLKNSNTLDDIFSIIMVISDHL
ncbi:hypothetical protein Csa_019098 [Cucumis sativus]|nr:hypothetical protein Csa_019098 [Cucumis sativus]